MYKPNRYVADHSGIKTQVLSALAYYDLFNFPLTKEEVFLFMNVRSELERVEHCLNELANHGLIYQLGNYYALKNDDYIVTRRKAGGKKAEELLAIAEKVSRYLIKFPYVRGIAVSGSLSKRYADDKSDIDFFIITSTNRLWIARSLLHMLKKISFLFNKQDYFCMNYFVDEARAEIVEQNLFTATETITLIPLQGDLTFERFYSANTWTREYLPNHLMRVSCAEPANKGWVKSITEGLFNNAIGDILDNWLMRITARSWNKKTEAGRLNQRGVLMSMMATKGYAKPNPVNFQNRIMTFYNEKVERLTKSLEQDIF
jgi:predicted nucleotidyltransferase